MSQPGRFFRTRRNSSLALAGDLPTALFAPRRELIRIVDGHPCLHQLSRTWSLSSPIDWDLRNDNSPTHLERLAFHYLEFAESLDAATAEAVMLDWIRSNPPWQPGYWLDSWNSYAISIRTVCMMQWLAANRDQAEAPSIAEVTGSIGEQIRFLSRNLELDICGNHLVKNIKALLWAGRCFRGKESGAWTRRGKELLSRELDAQFLPDGMHFELSPAYHCQVFADVLECAQTLKPEECQSLVDRLFPAAQVIADLTHPDGLISLFSDAGLNMAYCPEQCLAAYERLGGVRPAPRCSFEFASAGYYGTRSEAGFLLFDCGPSCADSLPAHGHGDILAFEWDVVNQRIVVDAGVREYETGQERNWNRSTRAHNTVTVGDRDQCEFVKSFRVGYRAHGKCAASNFSPGNFSITGEYKSDHADGQVVQHFRTVSGTLSDLKVADRVTSHMTEPAVARLLLHHDCMVTPVSRSSVVVECNDIKIRITADSPIRVTQSKWSPNFGEEFETTQLEFEYGNTPCESSFTLKVESHR